MRHIKFGEGAYDVTEKLIRRLLTDANPGVSLPAPTDTADDTPDPADITRETYLGSPAPNSYRLVSTKDIRAGSVTVTVGRGVQAYSFTFG